MPNRQIAAIVLSYTPDEKPEYYTRSAGFLYSQVVLTFSAVPALPGHFVTAADSRALRTFRICMSRRNIRALG
jgi:hypothetical protein